MSLIEETSFQVDREVVRTWVEGWALSRGTPASVEAYGGFRVEVGLETQRARYVFPGLSEGVRRAADAITEPAIFLKVCASPEAMRDLLPERWTLQPLNYLMTCDGSMGGSDAPLLDGYSLDLVSEAGVWIARILTEAGDIASSGYAAGSGDYLVYDRIVTDPGHQRRGLGRIVMKALEAAGRARARTNGLLVATEDGRALYQALGWRIVSPYTSAVIPANP